MDNRTKTGIREGELMGEHIYEIVDTTNDEMYFTAGVYDDLEKAVDEVMSRDPDQLSSSSTYHEDYIKIEIRKRKLNALSDHVGDTVRVFEWAGTEDGGWEAI